MSGGNSRQEYIEEEFEGLVRQQQRNSIPNSNNSGGGGGGVVGGNRIYNDNRQIPLENNNGNINTNNTNNNNNNNNRDFDLINKHLNDQQQQGQPLKHGCDDNWLWSKKNRSKEVVLSGHQNRTVHFHPNWSKGTAGIRGKRPLNNGRFYWELHVSQRVFGTSIMFGIGTKNARVHANSFTNMLGEDESGWGLSHKGILWHKGIALMYTKRFRENQSTIIGILFDGIEGTLTYYKDGKCLGVGFRGLDKVKEPLYPIVCSTAAKTEMTLKSTRRDFVNLQDRCRAEIIKHVKHPWDLDELKLPPIITDYLAEVYNDMKPLRPVDNYDVCDF